MNGNGLIDLDELVLKCRIVGQIRASLGNILRLIESNHPIQTPEGVWIRL